MLTTINAQLRHLPWASKPINRERPIINNNEIRDTDYCFNPIIIAGIGYLKTLINPQRSLVSSKNDYRNQD